MAIATAEMLRLGQRHSGLLGGRGGTSHQAAGGVGLGFGLLLGAPGPVVSAIKAGLSTSPLASDARFSAVARWAASETPRPVDATQQGLGGSGAPIVFRDARARFAAAVGRWNSEPGGTPEQPIQFRDSRPARAGPSGAKAAGGFPGQRIGPRVSMLRPNAPQMQTADPVENVPTVFAKSDRVGEMRPAVEPTTTDYPIESKRFAASLRVPNLELRPTVQEWGRPQLTSPTNLDIK